MPAAMTGFRLRFSSHLKQVWVSHGQGEETKTYFFKEAFMRIQQSKFPLGRTLITPGAQEALHPEDVMKSISRHVSGDWGDCGPEDWQENELSLHERLRLFSVYHDRNNTKFWVITEADRSATTVLLPSEY